MSKHALCWLLGSAVCCLACDNPTPKAPARSLTVSGNDRQDPVKAVQAFEETLRTLPAYTCKLQAVIHLKTSGMDNRMVSDYSVRVAQPGRWSIVQESGMLGGTSVSDGRQVTNYVPMLQRYSVDDLPEGWLDDMPGSGPAEIMGLMGPGAFANCFLGHGLVDWLLEGVSKSEHLGRESIEGVDCERYRFTQEEGTRWELWVEVGEQTLFRRFAMQPKVSEDGGLAQEMSMGVQLDFTDWDTAASLTDDDFVFDPPAGAKKTDNLFGAASEPEPHVLIGQEAPDFVVQHLDGSSYKLEEQLGEKVIVLDFWATWCGPCTAALPGLASVAKEFEGDDVSVFAVNQGEEIGVVQEFLDEKQLDLPVLLDTEGTVGELYAVEGIPMTTVIGKDKRVQVVHVGYARGMEKKLTKEIKQLLAGEDLAAEAEREAAMRRNRAVEAVEEKGVDKLWTLEGSYVAVAVDDRNDMIIALERGGKVAHVSESGEPGDQRQMEEAGSLLRLANLTGVDESEFVTFDAWGKGVYACDSRGGSLWTYSIGQGVDDVACADLNGDGLDEVIIGYNGSTGLHVLDNRGNLLWKTTSIGNVWHVAAGNFLPGGAAQVVTTSAQGKLHVFSAVGDSLTAHDVSIYANMVRLIPLDDEPLARALVGGSGTGVESLLLIEETGRERWELELPALDSAHIDSLVANSESARAAVGMRGGLVHVVDVKEGAIIATVGQQGTSPQVALMSTQGETLLLVATGRQLNAFAVDSSTSAGVVP